MLRVGLVSVDRKANWIGGRYYLHHLVRSVQFLPTADHLPLYDVWWREAAEQDPWAEVRDLLAGRRVVAPPISLAERIRRRFARSLSGTNDARDLFVRAGIDVLFPSAPCANPGVPLVFWIPDVQHRRLPELFTTELGARFDRRYETQGRLASVVAVSSEAGRRDVERFFPQLTQKLRVLRFSSVPSSEWWQQDPERTAARYELPERFFILSNQFSHHKNHMMVLEAVRRLRDDLGVRATVVCTGSTWGFRGEDYFRGIQEFIAAHDLAEEVRILGLIPRAEQIALTRRSLAMLQPSRFEGWSTVVEDARVLGKPILLSDIDVHREQNPAGAIFAPPDDASAWRDAMGHLLDSRAPGPHLVEEQRGAQIAREAAVHTATAFKAILEEAAGRTA